MALRKGPSPDWQCPKHSFTSFLPPSDVICQEGARQFLMQGCWQDQPRLVLRRVSELCRTLEGEPLPGPQPRNTPHKHTHRMLGDPKAELGGPSSD